MPTSYPHPKKATTLSLLATTLLTGWLGVLALQSPTPQILQRTESQRTGQAEPFRVEGTENGVNGEAILAIAIAGSAGIGLGLSALVERDRNSRQHSVQSSSRRGSTTASHQPALSSINVAQVRRPLQRKLLRLLNGDQKAATRLLTHTSLKYPGNTLDWYAEKAIYDLERDRGKY